MANLFNAKEDTRRLPGTSGAESNDLKPEQNYDTDLRRIRQEDRLAAASLNKKQDSIGKRIKAARSAGKYKAQRAITEYETNGEIPINARSAEAGTVVPGLRLPGYGDPGAGGTNYPRKPKAIFGRPFV